ncbi:MAG: hypothetical protein ABFS30_12060 [Pseudomonadota bacterium]
MIDRGAAAMNRARRRGLSLGLAALLLSLPVAGGSVRAEVGPIAVKNKIEAEYRVTVLKTTQVRHNGLKAYRLTVMNRGGDFNEAFQVNTLIVDAGTGRILSQFRHGSSGHQRSGAWDRRGRERTDALRGRIWR